MEITANLQSIIILSIVIGLLLIVATIISYKLGEKKRVGNEIHNEIRSDQFTSEETRTKAINHALPIIDQKKIMLYRKDKESNISPVKLYEEKIEQGINKTEKDINKESNALDLKFLKYTSEGYKPAKGDKESGALGWR